MCLMVDMLLSSLILTENVSFAENPIHLLLYLSMYIV